MRSEFKAKLLQHMLANREDKGFTLIELLVVIIIIGILAAIALPSFLNQANKARQSEAKTYTGSMNRSQQAYFLEKQIFTSSIPLLGLGIATTTANYQYLVSHAPTGVAGTAATWNAATDSSVFVNNYGANGATTLKGYVGVTWVGKTSNGEATTLAILCEHINTGNSAVTGLTSAVGGTTTQVCGANMDTIK